MAKNLLYIIPITIFYLGLKSTVFASMPLPDVLLMLTFYYASRRPTLQVAFLGFALGYVEDASCGGIVGSTSTALVAVFLAVYFLSRKVHFVSAGVNATAAMALVLLKTVVIYFVTGFSGSLLFIVAQVVLTGVLTPIAFSLLGRVMTISAPRFEG